MVDEMEVEVVEGVELELHQLQLELELHPVVQCSKRERLVGHKEGRGCTTGRLHNVSHGSTSTDYLCIDVLGATAHCPCSFRTQPQRHDNGSTVGNSWWLALSNGGTV